MQAHRFSYFAALILTVLPSVWLAERANRIPNDTNTVQRTSGELLPAQTNQFAQSEDEDNGPPPEYCYTGSAVDSFTGEIVDLYTLCDDFEEA